MSVDSSRVIKGVHLLAVKAHIHKIRHSEALRLALLSSH